MKKYWIISFFALVTVVFSGCTYYYPSGGETPCNFHQTTTTLSVTSSQWEFDNDANMFYCHFDVPAITNDVYKNAEFSIHRKYNYDTQKEYLVALPETTYKSEEVINDDGTTSTVYYQQHLDYAIGVGYVEIFCTISDFYYNGFIPDAMKFRLQMTY